MKILITGASGLVATELCVYLLEHTDYQLTLISRQPEALYKRYRIYGDRISCLTLSELIEYYPSAEYDTMVHTAFARSVSGQSIADSLSYLSDLCRWVKSVKVGRFINISSQSVYGNDYTPGIDENGKCAPDYLYALGKYSSELISEAWLSESDTLLFQIRLASVCENARFVKVFVENILKGLPIKLVAPRQIVSFIDVRDVATALYAIIQHPQPQAGYYNLGIGNWYPISEIAEKVVEIGRGEFGIKSSEIIIENNENSKMVGMSNDKFCERFHWTPQYTIEDMIRSIFNMLININGGYPVAFKLVYGL